MKVMIVGSGVTGLALSDYFAKHKIDTIKIVNEVVFKPPPVEQGEAPINI